MCFYICIYIFHNYNILKNKLQINYDFTLFHNLISFYNISKDQSFNIRVFFLMQDETFIGLLYHGPLKLFFANKKLPIIKPCKKGYIYIYI